MAILWMVPIYSVTSWLSLVFPPAQPYLGVIRDCYEAYVVYTFIAFLKSALAEDEDGNPQNVIEVLAKQFQTPAAPATSSASISASLTQREGVEEESLQGGEPESEEITRSVEGDLEQGQGEGHPPPSPAPVGVHHLQKAPCPCCIPSRVRKSPIGIADATLHQCEVMAMQFVFFKPLLATAPFFLQLCGYDYEAHPPLSHGSIDWLSARLYVLILGNLSVSLAFYGLLCFFHLTEKDLAWCRPWPKFLCVKGVVFMTFWQDILLQCMSGSGVVDTRSAGQIQNLLICIEMFMAAIAHFYVFPYEEWDIKKRRQASLEVRDTMAFYAFLSDFKRVIKGGDQQVSQAHHKTVEGEGEGGGREEGSEGESQHGAQVAESREMDLVTKTIEESRPLERASEEEISPLRFSSPPLSHPSHEREEDRPLNHDHSASESKGEGRVDHTPSASPPPHGAPPLSSSSSRRSPQVFLDSSDSDSDGAGAGAGGGGDKAIQSV
jgi:hypothetical protein